MPADWIKAIIVPIYKGRGRRVECGSYRLISLLSIPGKVYGSHNREGATTYRRENQ